MVSGALQIAILSRLASRTFALRGEEDLQIAADQHPASPYFNRKPVPVMFDNEMFLTWQYLAHKKQKLVLAQLKRAIMNKKPQMWLQTFLTVFVLMSNLEFCYQHQVRKLKLHQKAAVGVPPRDEYE